MGATVDTQVPRLARENDRHQNYYPLEVRRLSVSCAAFLPREPDSNDVFCIPQMECSALLFSSRASSSWSCFSPPSALQHLERTRACFHTGGEHPQRELRIPPRFAFIGPFKAGALVICWPVAAQLIDARYTMTHRHEHETVGHEELLRPRTEPLGQRPLTPPPPSPENLFLRLTLDGRPDGGHYRNHGGVSGVLERDGC